ncbi:MAG: HAD family hydrolase [Prevotella sp.]
MKSKYIIFDLDDTLVYEIDFLKSAYKEIAGILEPVKSQALFDEMCALYKKKENVFEVLHQRYPGYSKEDLLDIYRNHFPTLILNDDADNIFKYCKEKGYKIGLLSDGRSITQRNKLKSVKIENVFDKIVISEEFGNTKPNIENYKVFVNDGKIDYYYIADNPQKDFLTPNKLGWITICLLNKGKNIHIQNFDLDTDYLPKMKISNLKELFEIL